MQVHFYGLSKKDEYKEACSGFAGFQKKMVPILKDLLARTIWHIKVEDAGIHENRKYIHSMQIYETSRLNEYSDGDGSK